jgi:tRNA dimethylallyltransferase
VRCVIDRDKGRTVTLKPRLAPIVVIAGATASGKSALALAVAEAFGGVVINADSMQVYRGVEVATAQPPGAARARAPHRLYGVLDPADPCNAARWRAMALDAIAAAHAEGRLPVVAGGTGLYLRALRRGLAPVPSVSQVVRHRVKRKLESMGHEGFHAWLAARDPAVAGRVPASDTQRLVRAAEVLEATGRSLSQWHAEQPAVDPGGLCFLELVLLPERALLYAACDRRFLEMMAAGAEDEVRALVGRGIDRDLPVMKAVGIAELCRYIDGTISRPEAIRLAQQATRRFAKRQVTWIRHQMPHAETLVPSQAGQFSETFLDDIFKKIRHFLLTTA